MFLWNGFWTGVAHKPYTLAQDLDDQFCHLTKMHFFGMTSSDQTVPNPTPQEFIAHMETQPGFVWKTVLAKIRGVIKKTMLAAVARCPVMRDQPQCRAIYGVDIMLTHDFEPRLLEVQFDPACKEGFLPQKALACLLLGDESSSDITRLM